MGTSKNLYENMFRASDSFRIFVSKFWVFVFRIVSYTFSFKAGKWCYSSDQIDTNSYKKGSEVEEFGLKEEKFKKIEGETENSVMVSSTSKYELLCGKNISGFIEEPKSSIFSVQELYMGSNDSTEGEEDSVDRVLNKQEKQEEEMITENEMIFFTEFRFLPKYDLSNEVHFLSVDSEFDTIGFSRNDDDIELAERNFSEGMGTESVESTSETYDVRDVTFDSDDDYIELKLESHSSSVLEKHEEEEAEPAADCHRLSEESQLGNSAVFDEQLLSSEVLNEAEDLVYEAIHIGHASENFEESSLKNEQFIQDDDEFALEHDDLIEQLKNARTGGLPTILEESESPPKTVEELKPLKIDQKFEHKDHMKEIHKFYRSYSVKMRKLDILNSQTMHAIDLFQLKGLGQSIQTQKSSVPAIKSLLTQNLWPSKPRRSEANPTIKLIVDLHKDSEFVYVGQLCLSWEILHWQYRKALELQEFDSQELHQYNQVAGEFQLFQVLLQRFIENEPFQGCPRVQNYVNNRCACCYFLQVPVIKDDSLRDKKGRKGDGEDSITSPMLTAIIEKSMQVYWEFLHADRDENDIMLKGPKLQDSVDSELLADIRTDYQKKEKRFKEILRSGSCIVKKLQKQDENRINCALFFGQVEMKLISRVLCMSKLTTDQLVWCHEKLAKINFCNRKLVLEPSFLLFPCFRAVCV